MGRDSDAVFEIQRKTLERIAVIMNLVFAVGDDHGFVIVNISEARTDEMPFLPLELQTCCNRKTEVHLLEVLLGDVAAFRLRQGLGFVMVVNRIDLSLEFITVVKSDKRDRRLDKERKNASVVCRFAHT